MKISEIKKCFDDKRISDCVAKTFWEEKDFSNALGSSKIETTPDNVYNIIKDVFLNKYEIYMHDKKAVSIAELKKGINRLSKLMYDDKFYWAKNTKFETCIKNRNSYIINIQSCEFLYKRLSLNRKNEKDIIKKIAKCNYIVESILKFENSNKKIETLEDLYESILNSVLTAIHKNILDIQGINIMNTISSMVYKDKNYWIIQNEIHL